MCAEQMTVCADAGMPSRAGSRWKGPCLVAAAMIAGLGFTVASAAAPRPGATSVAVVFMPGTGFPEAATRLATLDARIMRIGAAENIVIARFPHGWSLPALWKTGALFPLDALPVGDCLLPRMQALSPLSPAKTVLD